MVKTAIACRWRYAKEIGVKFDKEPTCRAALGLIDSHQITSVLGESCASLKVVEEGSLLTRKLEKPVPTQSTARLWAQERGLLGEVELCLGGMFCLPLPAAGRLEVVLDEHPFGIRSVDVC
jgi:hypothetical protein